MSKNTITHFIWGYQQHFATRACLAAERVLRNLDKAATPQLFLVAVLADESLKKWPACVEPEDDFWLLSSDCESVPKLAEEFFANDPLRDVMHSHPVAHQNHLNRLHGRSLQKAIQSVVDSHPKRPAQNSFFTGWPVKIGSYWVSAVLGIETAILDKHPRLKKQELVDGYRPIPVYTSLLDATIQGLLGHFAEEMQKPDPGKGYDSLDAEEAVRAAAKHFMAHVSFRIDKNALVGHEALFRSCNIISSLSYEKAAGKGGMLLARSNHPSLQLKVKFSAPTNLRDFRAARKLLELTARGLCLVSTTESIQGLGSLENYDTSQEDAFELKILGRHHWELVHAGQSLMRVEYGQPYLPYAPFDEGKLRHDLHRLFETMTSGQIDQMIELVRQAERETHGTMLIISDAAADEAKRLASQGAPISACHMTAELLQHLTPIDGAVLLSPDGVCHSIGTILDGLSSANGSPSRGARFNSAIRYVETTAAACLAVVISSDGGVDFIPDLPAAIRRTDIEEGISRMETFLKETTIHRGRFYDQIKWFEQHAFYLLPSHCETINRVATEIEQKLWAEEPDAIRIIRTPFSSHPAMNEKFFYLENIAEIPA